MVFVWRCRVTLMDNTTQGKFLDHIDAKGGRELWLVFGQRGGHMYIQGNDSCVQTGQVVCTFYDLIPERATGQRRIEGARDPSYFKRAGKRRTEGVIRKFRRC